uniref:Uncharacterized protein n=1 Tax=Helianthus annuus TaxID=4232 RepID=A0A1Y3BUG9_HELAN
MPQGYAVIDLEILNPSEVLDICLSKFVTLLLQSSFTAAGCYLCAAPGSKGTKILVCCSVNSASPMKMGSYYVDPFDKQNVYVSTELSQIIETENHIQIKRYKTSQTCIF